jgi:serine protease Do
MLFLLTSSLPVGAQPPGDQQTPRGFLGVLVSLAEEGQNGVLVREVTPDSPAAKAGLKAGDRVIKIGDEEVRDVEKFMRTVAAKKPGDQLLLGILRDGKERNLTATLGDRPAREVPLLPSRPGFRRPAFLGVQTQELTPEQKERLKVDTEVGVVVSEVVPDSPADKAGLKRDDVITALGDRPTTSPAELRDDIQKSGPNKEVTLHVLRGKEKLSIKATPGENAYGFFPAPGDERFVPLGPESMLDQARRIRELERRIGELEKQLRELQKK